MSKNRYRELQQRTKMSNTLIAEFFGVNVTTARRWGNGKIPAPAAVLLCLESIISGLPVNANAFVYPNKLVEATKTLTWAIQHDPSYAYSWHCNIAGAVIDSEVDYHQANEAAARFMYDAFKVDTITGMAPFLGKKGDEHEKETER